MADQSALPVLVQQALSRADDIAGEVEASNIEQAAAAENTRRTYDAAWRTYNKWCALQSLRPLGDGLSDDDFAKQVRRYLAVRRNKCKVTTLAMDLVVIDRQRVLALMPRIRDHPVTVKFLRALRVHRRAGSDSKRKVNAIMPDLLQAMLDVQPNTVRGERDRALMLVMFYCGMRRSEACEMQFQDIVMKEDRMVVRLTHSKTDQAWKGRELEVDEEAGSRYCPVNAMRIWLRLLGDRPVESPLFPSITGKRPGGIITTRALTGNTVRLLVTHSLAAAGKDPEDFSGHSFRAGLITTLYRRGVPISQIMQITGHKSEKMVLEYVRSEMTVKTFKGLLK